MWQAGACAGRRLAPFFASFAPHHGAPPRQHYEAVVESPSSGPLGKGPVVNLRLSSDLVLKIFPDIALFYGALYLVGSGSCVARELQPVIAADRRLLY